MTKLKQFTIGFIVSCSALLAQQGTTTITTPFGPTQVPAPQAPETIQPQPQTPAQPAQPPATTAAQPAPQQATTPAQNDAAAGVALHLVNSDIRQVIQIIGGELGLNYIIDPSVKGTVDINTSDTLRRSDLLPILESILKINGATMIKNGNFYQIVPANTAAKQPIEVIDQRTTTASDDQVVMQIIRMKFVAASEMKNILSPFLTDAGSIVAHETGNIILLTDRRSNIRKLLEVLDEFDTSSFQGERIRLLPVKNNRARDVIEDLKTIFTGYGMSEKQSAIRLISIDRLNSILVVTPNPTVFPEVERWLTTLDQPVVTAGSRNFVYRVKNAKAADLQRVLAELYGLRGAVPVSSTPGTSGAIGTPVTNSQPPVNGTLAGALPALGQPLVSGNTTTSAIAPIRIIADETNNALVIQATAQEYSEIERTLEQLDVLRRQVLIDAQVYEVVLDNSLSFGVTAALQNRGTLQNPQTTASFTGTTSALAAQTFAFIGRTRELVTFLNASENRSKVRTLSAPSVLVSDNGAAQFEVGTEVPIPTSSSITPVQTGGTNLFAQTIAYQQTGVILNVKPQINESGNVTMDIMQEISAPGANTVSAIVAPAIAKSAVTSTVVIQDGQTIALGGFIRESTDLERNRIPLVGRVPGLGVLLGNTANSKTRTELIVLITPHVLRSHSDADSATEEMKAKLKEIKNLIQ
ncbi:MAG TPA: type II secretion system secretin GspD [Terriglobia bacterium]|nr:type II secretion system secretin GspD [Terriglobia bacterium]